jgi:predicted phage tail protein
MGEQKTDKSNRIVITYVDPNNDYEPNQVIFPEPRSFVGDGSTDDLFLRADNEQRIERTITLPHCTSREEALQYAEVFCRRSRSSKVISFQTNLSMAHCTVGDLIKVTDASIGLDGFFRITDLNLDNNNSAVITCDAVEHQSANYAIASKSEPVTVPVLKLPDPTVMAPVTNLTVSSLARFSFIQPLFIGGRANRMKVSWDASDSPFAVDFVVQFKLRTESDFTTYTITDDTEVFIPNVVSNQKYDIRVCARNNLGMRSDFVRAEHTVQGFFPIFPRTKSHDQDMSS